MITEQGQLHLIRATIFLKKVLITVRFPCSISFSLKHQQQVVENKEIYDLKGGESTINKSIDIELQVLSIRGRYEERKVLLLIFMVSPNGKIPAGTVTINPTDKISSEKKIPLQKCPDKNAEVSFTQTFERIHIVNSKGTDFKKSRVNLAGSNVSGYSYLNRSQAQHYSSSSKLLKDLDKKTYDAPREPRQEKSMKNSLVGSQGENKNFPKFSQNRFEEGLKRNYGASERDPSELRISRASQHVAEGLQWQVESQKSKIFKLQQQKTTYIKQIAKLKGSMRVQSQEHFYNQKQYNKVIQEKGKLQDDVEKLKQRFRFQQKRQKQLNGLLKELRDEIDKKKGRIAQLDSSKHQIEVQLIQKERLINTLQSEKKKLQQSLQQEKIMQQSLQKRLDLKQNSYKDQLKKLNEKYTQSQLQRQKSMLDYNNILLQIENAQKQSQLQLREKQKKYTEQKNKLGKKIQQLSLEKTQLQQKISQNITIIRDYQYQHKRIIEEEKYKQQNRSIIKQNYESLNLEMKKVEGEKKNLENDLKRLQQILNQDKVNYKKKIGEVSNELALCKDKLDKSLISCNNQEIRVKDLENNLEKERKQKLAISMKLEQLKKVHKKCLQQQQNRHRMEQNLSLQNISQNNKVSQFKNRLQSQKKNFEMMEKKYEQQVHYLVKSKEYLQNQIEEYKWMVEKENQKFETLSIKNRDLSEQVISISQQIIKHQQKCVEWQLQRQQYDGTVRKLQLEIIKLQSQNNSINENLKKKQEEYYFNEKKGNHYELQLHKLEQNLNLNLKDMNEKIEDYQRKLHAKARQIKDKEQELNSLSQELQVSRTAQSRQKDDILSKNNQILTLKELNKQLRDDLVVILAKTQQLKQQGRIHKQTIQQYDLIVKKSNQELLEASFSQQKVQKDFEQYKSTSNKAIQQILLYFIKQKYSENKKQIAECQLLPNQDLSNLQMQCMKKHFSNWQYQQQTIKDQATSIKYLEQDIYSLKRQMEKIRLDCELSLRNQQNAHKAYKEEKQANIQDFESRENQLNAVLQQKKNQIEFLRVSSSKYEEMISQFTDQSIKSREKENQLKMQINSLERQIFALKEKEIKVKYLSSNQSQEFKQRYSEDRLRYEELINSLKQIINKKQIQLIQKAQDIKKHLLIQSQLKFKNQQQKAINSELKNTLQAEASRKRSLEKTLHDKERMIKEYQEIINENNMKISVQKQNDLQREEQSKKNLSDINNLSDKYLALKNDYNKRQLQIQQNEKRERQRRQKAQISRCKLQQENKQFREKAIRVESQLELYKFYRIENSKKIEELERLREQNFMQMQKCKQNIIKSQKQIDNFENKHYKLDMEMANLSQQKEALLQSNLKLKSKIEQYQQPSNSFQTTLNKLEQRQKEIGRLQERIRDLELQNEKANSQLKNIIAKSKEDMILKNNKIKELQKKLDEKNSDLSQLRVRITAEFNNEKNMYETQLEVITQNVRVLEEELDFQKQQTTKEIEGANSIIQQLNEVIRQKEETLQYRQEVINEQTVRLDELNMQLSECVSKWEREKEMYVPAAERMAEVGEELARMNKFMSELDGRSKQLLEINKRKMQQTIESRPSITEILKQLYLLMQRNKNKILNRCQTEKEKETVVLQFKALQEKLDFTLKNTQIVVLKS